MAVAPDGFTPHRLAQTYQSATKGELVIHTDHNYPGCIFAYYNPRYSIGNNGEDTHKCRIWENGVFRDEEIQKLAGIASTDAETMNHWLREEVLKFTAVLKFEEEEVGT